MFNELNTDAESAAKRLLGCVLEREINGKIIRAKIVETESYDQDDPASHTFRGPTPRNEIMFGPAGFLYVYFIYGMHYCANVVTGPDGHGEAALIRAVEPIDGIDIMKIHRPNHESITLTNGPSKLCYALDVNKDLNGHDLSKSPLRLVMQKPVSENEMVATTRIGIKEGKEKLWRFYLKDNLYISRK